jgi:hypothetical protein
MGKSTRFAIERNQTLPRRSTVPDTQSKGLAELTPEKPTYILAAPKIPEAGVKNLAPDEQNPKRSGKKA